MSCLEMSRNLRICAGYEQLAAELADSRLIAREQENFHVAAKMRVTALEAENKRLRLLIDKAYDYLSGEFYAEALGILEDASSTSNSPASLPSGRDTSSTKETT